MFELNINKFLEDTGFDEYDEEYNELKDKTYHLNKEILTMGFKSIKTKERTEIPIEYEIKNNIILIHNFEEIKKHQSDYHEIYSITESVINSIIESFAFALRDEDFRNELGLKLKCFEY